MCCAAERYAVPSATLALSWRWTRGTARAIPIPQLGDASCGLESPTNEMQDSAEIIAYAAENTLRRVRAPQRLDSNACLSTTRDDSPQPSARRRRTRILAWDSPSSLAPPTKGVSGGRPIHVSPDRQRIVHGRRGHPWQQRGLFIKNDALVAFVAGAATTAILVDAARRRRQSSAYPLPPILEALLLLIFGFIRARPGRADTAFVSATVAPLCCMRGRQNAVITKISYAEFRTAHMTGIVTALGIEFGKVLYVNGSGMTCANVCHDAIDGTRAPTSRPASRAPATGRGRSAHAPTPAAPATRRASLPDSHVRCSRNATQPVDTSARPVHSRRDLHAGTTSGFDLPRSLDKP